MTSHGVSEARRSVPGLWKDALRTSSFRWQFAGSVSLLIVTLMFFTRFLMWVEVRSGAVLSDPVLRMFEPRDFSWLTFGLIYGAIIAAILHLKNDPAQLLLALQAYTLMVIVRSVMMWVTPLDTPEGHIVLRDPLVQLVGNGEFLTRDLFFSGHTATMFILFLTSSSRLLKGVFLIATLLVATLVLWQHAHYVVDVLVAPFVAYGSFRFVQGVAR